ncbi:MAG: hypothetical protein IH934_02150 [Nanoarchaeota archaeon]|nr:hypothetical protein [Nanoarchaeota archaeon]
MTQQMDIGAGYSATVDYGNLVQRYQSLTEHISSIKRFEQEGKVKKAYLGAKREHLGTENHHDTQFIQNMTGAYDTWEQLWQYNYRARRALAISSANDLLRLIADYRGNFPSELVQRLNPELEGIEAGCQIALGLPSSME